jgi:hypothetical protein
MNDKGRPEDDLRQHHPQRFLPQPGDVPRAGVTPLQTWQQSLGDLLSHARDELDLPTWIVFVSILTARAARENRLLIDLERAA